jgi:deoxyribonuclease-4
MLHIGCHLSASKGYYAMGKTALSIGADTFQFFTRNPRGSRAKPLDLNDAQKLNELAAENHFAVLLAHAPYTINPCSANEDTRTFARETMQDDLKRLEATPHNLYNFHPGSHVKQGVEVATEQICDMLNAILWQDMKTTVLLETMAGKGSEVGRTFEELRAIIDRTELNDKLGVCLDTCHVSDAGYDIVNHLEDVLADFDRVIGLNRLKAIHLNDSKNPCGAHKDRHEQIGKGYIGLEALMRVVNHPSLKHLPFELETPNDLAGYAAEIKQIRELAE